MRKQLLQSLLVAGTAVFVIAETAVRHIPWDCPSSCVSGRDGH
jgi:hypothetical protein